MSSGLENKMYDYEVSPPTGVWEKIAAELDESELEHQFPSTLHNLEVAPPATAWQNIAATLDESALVNDYAGRLAGISVVPPVAAWNKIKTSLEAEYEAAAPKYRRFSPFLKYAAAAAIIGFLAWGSIEFFNNKNGDTTVAKQGTFQTKENAEMLSSSQTLSAADENIGLTNVAASIEEARNDAALEQSKKTYAKLDIAVTRSKIKNAANFFFVADEYEPTGTRGLDIEPIEPPSINLSNRYIMLMTPDGNIIRMSKKFTDMVCCVSGEDEDAACRDQIKKWREKIICSPACHTAGSFMNMLDLVEALEDN